MNASSVKPLDGVRILDLTQAYSGPFCTMHLADHGAEVIKVEIPGIGDQSRNWEPLEGKASGYYSYINRNKFGITLNLKDAGDREKFLALVKTADVVCENFRVGTMQRLGLGYDELKQHNPRIIYASISGFGLEGERAGRPCYDIVAQAEAGLISLTGSKDKAYKVGPAIADSYSGTYLALGIAMALFQRERTGEGRRIDVSMINTVFSILEASVMEYTVKGNVPYPVGNRDFSITPFDMFSSSDGQVVIACGTDKFFEALCRTMCMPELISDRRFCSNTVRCANEPALKSIIEAWTKQHTSAELDRMISEAKIPFGIVRTVKEACEMEEIKNQMLRTVYDPSFGHSITVPGSPIKMHGCDDRIQRPAPLIGEHNEVFIKPDKPRQI